MQDKSVTFKPATFRQDVPSCYRFLYQYPQKQHLSFANRLIRIIPDTISHFQEFPVDILFCAGVGLGCLGTAAVVSTLAPVLLTPAITFIPPALGFAGYNVTNSLIGSVPGLLISYQLNRCIAAPARNAREHREEGWTRKIARVTAKMQLITLTGGLLGAAFIPYGHALGYLVPLF